MYGSKPKKAYEASEKKWFGGILGGHVGVEKNDEGILHFLPDGAIHLVGQPKNPKSRFVRTGYEDFYQVFGGDMREHKKLIITIPINEVQVAIFDSIAQAYLNDTPYDYAFKGMRCAAAAYDVLAQLNIVELHTQHKTSRSIFYPRVLRKLLIKNAARENWFLYREPGKQTRKWDKD